MIPVLTNAKIRQPKFHAGFLKPGCKVVGAILLGLGLIGAPIQADAGGKFQLLFGYFSVTAKTDTSSGRLSNLGLYSASYRYGISNSLDFGIGYTLFSSSFLSGDMGFGPDLSLTLFPVTHSSPTRALDRDSNTELIVSEGFRPFVGAGFHQRQFQSISATYAGFSLQCGFEKSWLEGTDYKMEMRYQVLGGPRGASATQIDLIGGISLRY